MRVRYAGDGTAFEKGRVYELYDVTEEGFFKLWSEAAGGWTLLPPSDFELAERPLSRSPHYKQESKPEWTTFYSGCFCCVLEIGEDKRLRLTKRFYSRLAADDYAPEVTFVPQCSQCEHVRKCSKARLLLYRRNYIRCTKRVSDEPFWEPNANMVDPIEEQFEKMSRLYTEEELREARETLAKLTDQKKEHAE